MEELAIKIAELLDITVESAIKLYPVLRSQFIIYKITNFIARLSVISITFVVMYIILYWFITDSRLDSQINKLKSQKSYFDSDKEIKKIDKKIKEIEDKKSVLHEYQFKKFVYVLIPIFIFIVLQVLQYIFASDLILLKEFL